MTYTFGIICSMHMKMDLIKSAVFTYFTTHRYVQMYKPKGQTGWGHHKEGHPTVHVDYLYYSSRSLWRRFVEYKGII